MATAYADEWARKLEAADDAQSCREVGQRSFLSRLPKSVKASALVLTLAVPGITVAISSGSESASADANSCLSGDTPPLVLTPGEGTTPISSWAIGNGDPTGTGFPGIPGATANPENFNAAVEKLNPGVNASLLPQRPLKFPADCI